MQQAASCCVAVRLPVPGLSGPVPAVLSTFQAAVDDWAVVLLRLAKPAFKSKLPISGELPSFKSPFPGKRLQHVLHLPLFAVGLQFWTASVSSQSVTQIDSAGRVTPLFCVFLSNLCGHCVGEPLDSQCLRRLSDWRIYRIYKKKNVTFLFEDR
ncbi:Hypothetical predicted protein [Cloeon dipterum]|uniref:Uncharacterized protein n=1 Tax=Cloeon dipterum TaxID=197152 RepID=A0A8S1C5I4_9INSE|nr:Hypothetical predicted protein [Cloeon dipterum]